MVDEWQVRPHRPVTVPLLHVRPIEQMDDVEALAESSCLLTLSLAGAVREGAE